MLWATPARLLVLTGFLTASAWADEPPVDAVLTGLSGRETVSFTTSKGPATRPAGLLGWSFPSAAVGPAGMSREFRTVCVEPLVPVKQGLVYSFRPAAVEAPAGFGLPDTDEGRTTASLKARYLRELYGRFYPEALNEGPAPAAFQLAVWEIVSESDVPDGPMPFNVFAGTFRADYAAENAAPQFVVLAQKWLLELTGDDTPFSTTPELQGYTLVRWNGVPNASGEVAQSQLVLMPGLPPDLAGPGGTDQGTTLGYAGAVAGGNGFLKPVGGTLLGGNTPGGAVLPGTGLPFVPFGDTNTPGNPGSPGGGGGVENGTGNPSPTPGVVNPVGGSGTQGETGGGGNTPVPGGGSGGGWENPGTPTELEPNPVPTPGGFALTGVAAALLLRRRAAVR